MADVATWSNSLLDEAYGADSRLSGRSHGFNELLPQASRSSDDTLPERHHYVTHCEPELISDEERYGEGDDGATMNFWPPPVAPGGSAEASSPGYEGGFRRSAFGAPGGFGGIRSSLGPSVTQAMAEDFFSQVPPASLSDTREVLLHLYDVSQSTSIQWLNALLAPGRLPFKLGGIFHAGIEVDGVEWVFGWSEEGTGVHCSLPRKQVDHHFRETLRLPRSPLPPERIREIILELKEEYTGASYDVLRRNCCHFADELCRRIGVGPIPRWVCRLAEIGDRASDGIDAFCSASSAVANQLGTSSCKRDCHGCPAYSGSPRQYPTRHEQHWPQRRQSCGRSRSPMSQQPRWSTSSLYRPRTRCSSQLSQHALDSLAVASRSNMARFQDTLAHEGPVQRFPRQEEAISA